MKGGSAYRLESVNRYTQRLCDCFSISRIGFEEVLQLTLDHITGNPRHGAGDVAGEQGFLLIVHQAEQRTGVAVIVGVFAVIVTIRGTAQGQCGLGVLWRLFRRVGVAVWLIVGRPPPLLPKAIEPSRW